MITRKGALCLRDMGIAPQWVWDNQKGKWHSELNFMQNPLFKKQSLYTWQTRIEIVVKNRMFHYLRIKLDNILVT